MLKNKVLFLIVAFLGIAVFSVRGCSAPSVDEGKNASVIEHIEWGKMIITLNGKEYQFRDCKLWPGNAKEWNWKETGTHHDPGIQIADLKELIDKVAVVILTRGMNLDLQVPQETIEYVKNKGKECHVGQTQDMVNLYNKLVQEGTEVGGLFHSTC